MRAARPPAVGLKPWPELMAAARARLAHHKSKPVMELPCRMVLSLARNGNGLLNVRCECMAGTVNRPSSRYYNYDTLGESLTIDQARDLFEVHLAAKGEDHGSESAG